MDFVRRIPVDIFEKWYADQDIYCKITHIPTAEELEKDYIFEYKQSIGKFEVPQCTTVKELIEEYVQIYGHDKWGVATYSGNIALINNYILPTIGDTKLGQFVSVLELWLRPSGDA